MFRGVRSPAIVMVVVACVFFPAGGASAQGLKLALGDFGIGIGPVPRLDGVRLNFRDDYRLERVRGLNATIWTPYEDVRGDVQGIALGLPLTGAHDVAGIAVGGRSAAHGG